MIELYDHEDELIAYAEYDGEEYWIIDPVGNFNSANDAAKALIDIAIAQLTSNWSIKATLSTYFNS